MGSLDSVRLVVHLDFVPDLLEDFAPDFVLGFVLDSPEDFVPGSASDLLEDFVEQLWNLAYCLDNFPSRQKVE